MTIENLSNNDMWAIRMALTNAIISNREEIRNPETPEEIRKTCERSLARWKNLKAKIVEQHRKQLGNPS